VTCACSPVFRALLFLRLTRELGRKGTGAQLLRWCRKFEQGPGVEASPLEMGRAGQVAAGSVEGLQGQGERRRRWRKCRVPQSALRSKWNCRTRVVTSEKPYYVERNSSKVSSFVKVSDHIGKVSSCARLQRLA